MNYYCIVNSQRHLLSNDWWAIQEDYYEMIHFPQVARYLWQYATSFVNTYYYKDCGYSYIR